MPQLLAIRVPADNLRGPLYMEQVLDALHTRNPRFRRVQLEIGGHGDEVMLSCRLPPALVPTFVQQLTALYPDGDVEHLLPSSLNNAGRKVYRRRLTLRPKYRYHPHVADVPRPGRTDAGRSAGGDFADHQ